MPYVARLQIVGEDDFELIAVLTLATNDNEAKWEALYNAGTHFDLDEDPVIRVRLRLADGQIWEEFLVRDRRLNLRVKAVVH